MIWTEATYNIEYNSLNIHILLHIWTNRWTMTKLFHLSWECSIQNRSKYAAYAVTALRDEQITAVRLCCADTLIGNGQRCDRSNVIFWHSAGRAAIYGWLSRFWLGCSDVHVRRGMVTDSWYSTNNRLTVSNVHRMLTLCKQKRTSALWTTNGERSTRNTSNRLWTCLLRQMGLEHFEIVGSVSVSAWHWSGHVARAGIYV